MLVRGSSLQQVTARDTRILFYGQNVRTHNQITYTLLYFVRNRLATYRALLTLLLIL